MRYTLYAICEMSSDMQNRLWFTYLILQLLVILVLYLGSKEIKRK